MVLIAKKQLEQNFIINDAENVNILGIDQGCILLFSAISSSISRNSNVPRTVIGGIQLTNGEQKIYHRHPSAIKITHASINASRSLCCFVTRTETYEAYVADIGSSGPGRLYSLNFSRSSPIRPYLAPHDVILLLYRDGVSVFRLPTSASAMDRSVTVDRDAQLNDCIYYQWDTLQQRLHVVQKRPAVLTKTALANGEEPFIYTAYTVNARGQFESIMKVDFDLRVPSSSLSQGNFEILSNESSLFLCWQLTMEKDTEKAEYAVVSLGHGRSFYLSKSLNKDNWEQYKSRKVHFGLLDGDYVFAILRGEFTHLLNFNVQLNFLNHLFFPNDPNTFPYDIKYTSQRGLMNKISTLLYDKRNLVTYTVDIDSNELIRLISPTTIYATISYAIIASKDPNILQRILEKILFEMYDDLNTKQYLMEILTALIFMRLAKRFHNNKYSLVFPATTVDSRSSNDPEVPLRSVAHHREYQPVRSGTTNLDQEYFEKLRTSFYHTRRYRHKLLYYHPIMTTIDENELKTSSFDGSDRAPRQFKGFSSPPQSPPKNQRPLSPRMFFPPSTQDFTLSTESNRTTNDNTYSSNAKRNDYLLENVAKDLNELQSEWGHERIKTIAHDYVQTTQSQCDFLIKSFTRLANFNRTQGFHLDDENHSESPSEKYKTLLVVIEKLYLAVVELGFSPTEELQKTLLEVSFRVMPFNRFVAAIDQNILTLTHDFVQQVIMESDNDDPKSYAIKEQLILMLPNTSGDSHSNLFDLIGTNRAKRMSAQILVARSYQTNKKNKNSNIDGSTHEIHMNENHSRLIEQAADTFYRDCCRRNTLDREELRTVERGLLTLASVVP